MSEVHLLSNPSTHIASYEWVPCNVLRLNRRNKLSSLPFWFPNDKMKWYQFRFVLLRGVSRKAASESDDAISVFVEYLPAPSDDVTTRQDYKEEAGGGSHHDNHHPTPSLHPPKGTRVTITIINPSSSSSSSKGEEARETSMGEEYSDNDDDGGKQQRPAPVAFHEEDTAVFNADERTLGFKEFIPAASIDHCLYEASQSLKIRVQLEVGVTMVAQAVVQTTDRIAASIWSRATNGLSALSSGISLLTKNMFDLDGLQREEAEHDHHHQLGASSSSGNVGTGGKTLPWDEVPPKWREREQEWRKLLTETLVMDEGTFLYGPPPPNSQGGSSSIMSGSSSRECKFSSDDQLIMTQMGINHRMVSSCAQSFEYDRDVHEGLLSIKSIRSVRYELVPKYIKDETFWANYMWKVSALSICTSEEQVKLLLSILNKPPPPPQPSSSSSSAKPTTTTSNASVQHSTSTILSAAFSSFMGNGGKVKGEEVSLTLTESMDARVQLEELLQEQEEEEEGEQRSAASSSSTMVLINSNATTCSSVRKRLIQLATRLGESGFFHTDGIKTAEEATMDIQKEIDAVDAVLGKYTMLLSSTSSSTDHHHRGGGDTQEHGDEEKATTVKVAGPPLAQPQWGQQQEEGDEDTTTTTVSDQPMKNKNEEDIAVEEEKEEEEEVPSDERNHDSACAEEQEEDQEAEEEATITPVVASGVVVVDDDDPFPEIDDMASPSPNSKTNTVMEKTPSGQTSSSLPPKTGSSSSHKLDFTPMPWEEDEDEEE